MAYYLFNTKLNEVLELSANFEEYKNLLKSGSFRKPTVSERIEYIKGKQKQSIIDSYSYKDGMLDVYFSAPEGRKDGHSTVADLLIKHCMQNGVYLNRNYTGQKIGLLYNHPIHINTLKTPYKIIYTGFESSVMPEEWKEYLNQANEVWTFSKYCQKVMKKTLKVDSKVFYHGIDTETFVPDPDKKDPDKVIFLHYDAFKWRKGWDLVLEAFNRKFENNLNAELWLKTTSKKGIPIAYDNIKCLKNDCTQSDLAEIMQKSDIFVFPSRGEGFGMPALEAIACNVECITINEHGISDYFDKRYFKGSKGKPIPARYDADRYKNKPLGNMYEMAIDDIANYMEQLYKKIHADKKAKRQGNKDLRQYALQYSSETHIKYIADRLKEIGNTNIKNDKPVLSLIVLTYNALDYTKKCLKSIKDNSLVDYEIIVIDNNSTDGTQDYLTSYLPDNFKNYRLVLNTENKGVAGGRNQGINLSNGIYCVFLDNDTEVSRGWDKTILNHFINNPEVWVVGHGGNHVYNYAPLVFKTPNKSHPVNYVDVVAGYCFAFPKYIIDLIGNQFEGLGRFWHEDLEFCGRVTKYGKRIIEDRNIPIVHYEHKSAGNNVKSHDEIKRIHLGFNEKAKKTGLRLLDKNIVTIFRGLNDPYSAYTIIADNLTKHLRDLGLVVLRKETIPFDLCGVSKSFYLCNAFYISYNGYSIGYMHQENDVAPAEWRHDLDTLDYAYVCSNFSKLAIERIGLIKNNLINTSLTGYDDRLFNVYVKPCQEIPRTKVKINSKFNILSVGASQPRKGTDILIKAFAEEFKKDEPVRLIIKNYNYGKHFWILEEIAKYPDAPEIIPVYQDWKFEELASFYRAIADNGIIVSSHRAEGVGMTLLEAVACGCDAIYSNFGGAVETMEGTGAMAINGTLTDSSFHNNLAEPFYNDDEAPKWFDPDIDELKKALRYKYEHRENNINIKAIEKWTFKNRALDMYNSLMKL